MEIRILGPVEVDAHGRAGADGTPQQRAVLAALAVDAGRSVPLDVLLERVWGHDPPSRARRTLHTHITRIRRLLEWAAENEDQPARVTSKAGGYILDIDPLRVDLHRFRDLRNRATGHHCPPEQRVLLLRAALDLWQGQPLAGIPGPWAVRSRQSMRQEHLDAVIAWAEAELRSGNPTTVVATVTDLLNEHPLVESLITTLLRALHATGRTAQALEFYLTTRNRFIEELGVEPGPELQRLHRALLRGDMERATTQPASTPGRPAIPKQLPMDVPGFTGRAAELSQLDALLPGEAPAQTAPTPVVISAVSGTAGVGKTALAVHWAHGVTHRFPDGQLYVNLRGYDPDQPMTAGEALARFLTALGVPSPNVPYELDERAARYRTEIAGRRTLIVLDNAATDEQVRPLLPGTATCAVLVTSRDSLTGLVALHGAQRIDLDLLPPADAITLLRRLIGARVDAEPDAAMALAEQCARLPLALRVAAERAISRPTTRLADLVTELADQQQRLHALDAAGDPRAAVTRVFSWSVRHLPPDAARTFGLLGLHPGPEFDSYATAALSNTSLGQARRTLDTLARAHLIHPTAPGRYGMHDLLHAYAKSLATTDSTIDRPRAALTRLFDYYLAAAASAMDVLYPAETHYRPRVPPPATPVPALADPDSARGWLDTERPNLTAIAAHSATDGWPDLSVRLATSLYRYLDGGHHTDALIIHIHAHRAAQQTGDHAGQAHALLGIGSAHQRLGRYEAAADHFHQALNLFRQTGDLGGEARSLNCLGIVEQLRGQHRPAVDHHEQALALFQHANDRYGEAAALANIGRVERQLGQYTSAANHLQQAQNLHRQTSDRDGEARTLNSLGLLAQQLGRYEQAGDHLQHALALFRTLGNRVGEAHTLDNLGTIHTRLGRPEQAARYFQQALTLFRDMGDRDGEAWVLNGLGEAAHTAGRPADTITHHTAALITATETGTPEQQARAHAGLGHAHRAIGSPDIARAHYTHALAIYTDLGMPDAEEINHHLTDLDATVVRPHRS